MGPGARIGDGGYTKLKQVKLLSTRGTQGSVLGIQFARKNAHIAPRAMWSLASSNLPSAYWYSLTPACAINGVDQRGRRGALDTPFLDSLPSM